MYTSCILLRQILLIFTTTFHLIPQKADNKLKTWNLSSTCLIYHTSKDISRTFIKNERKGGMYYSFFQQDTIRFKCRKIIHILSLKLAILKNLEILKNLWDSQTS